MGKRVFELTCCMVLCVVCGRVWEALSIPAYAVPSEPPLGEQTAVDTKNRVAVLDVARVFKECKSLTRHTEALQAEIEKAEGRVTAQRDEVAELTASLKNHASTTGEYRNIKQKIGRLEAEAKAGIELKKKEFIEKQAQIFMSTYDEMSVVIGKVANQKRLCLVMRYNGEPVDRTNPEEIFKDLNKSIIYHDGIDITDEVIEALNGQPLE